MLTPRRSCRRLLAATCLVGADCLILACGQSRKPPAVDHWAQRRGGAIPPELMGRIAPTRTEGINLRGLFRFPVERYADKILPSAAAGKTTVGTA